MLRVRPQRQHVLTGLPASAQITTCPKPKAKPHAKPHKKPTKKKPAKKPVKKPTKKPLTNRTIQPSVKPAQNEVWCRPTVSIRVHRLPLHTFFLPSPEREC